MEGEKVEGREGKIEGESRREGGRESSLSSPYGARRDLAR